MPNCPECSSCASADIAIQVAADSSPHNVISIHPRPCNHGHTTLHCTTIMILLDFHYIVGPEFVLFIRKYPNCNILRGVHDGISPWHVNRCQASGTGITQTIPQQERACPFPVVQWFWVMPLFIYILYLYFRIPQSG